MIAASVVEEDRPDRVRGGASSWRAEGERVLRVSAAGLLGGLVAGALVAGVGGRIAMRVVALQTPDGYQGLTTDDGAATGEITLAGTAGLIVFLTIAGAAAGLVYAAVRGALPSRRRPLVWGGTTGLVVGSVVIHADGVDYAVLGSRWVSAAMFAAVAAGYGALGAAVTERALAPEGLARRARPSRLALSFAVLLPGLVVVPVAVVLGVVTAVRAAGLGGRVPRRGAVLAVRAVGLLVVGAAGLDLARTLSELA